MAYVSPRIMLVNRCFVVFNHKLLLIKRSTLNTHNQGLWEAPGGKLDEGQDISSALEREVFEETKLIINPVNRISYYESQILTPAQTKNPDYIGLTYVAIFGIGKAESNKVRLSDEHDDLVWTDYKKIFTYKLTPETEKATVAMEKQLKKILKNS